MKIYNLQDKFKIEMIKNGEGVKLSYMCDSKQIFGLGERYSGVNHFGKSLKNSVFEKFTHQGDNAYFPQPFYFTAGGHGVFVDTDGEIDFSFTDGKIIIDIYVEKIVRGIHFFFGEPKEIIKEFVALTGGQKLPPKWAFGIWASANRWDSQEIVESELEKIKSAGYPVSVLVLEAWSDETTFYKWNDSKYLGQAGGKIKGELFQFDGRWKDPKGMIEKLHNENIKVVLWQIPAIKQLDEGQADWIHNKDEEEVIAKNLVALDEDGKPYKIPRQWFIGSLVPDFDKEEMRKWWFDKREYLLEMGVDGFKTDGGEFVHDLGVKFKLGDGTVMRNHYPMAYLKAYSDFVGDDRVIFSRAGYTCGATVPIHWAGDQMSTFDEMRSVLNAGLNASLCGTAFWSFDIAGFAGEMPTTELYIRGTQMGVFSPVMQWHSEPIGGQFKLIQKSFDDVNDRSPWNIAKYNNDKRVEKITTKLANLRMNLLPYVYSESVKAVRNGSTVMKHLMIDYPFDKKAASVHDQYLFGELMVAPMLYSGGKKRKVYFPKGEWIDIFTLKECCGGKEFDLECGLSSMLVFMKKGSVISLNLNQDLNLFGSVGNKVDEYENLCFVYYGDKFSYNFVDDAGNDFVIDEERTVGERTSSFELIDIKNLYR